MTMLVRCVEQAFHCQRLESPLCSHFYGPRPSAANINPRLVAERNYHMLDCKGHLIQASQQLTHVVFSALINHE
jgi:hypothetical protein